MNQQELDEIIDLHEEWVITNRESGQRAALKGVDLSGLDLIYANLIDVILRGANLYEAYLRGADLRNADLIDANLENADLTNTNIYSFTLGKHFAYFHRSNAYPTGNYLRIGCLGMSLQEWLNKYEEIGKKEGYSRVEVDNYGLMIKLLNHIK